MKLYNSKMRTLIIVCSLFFTNLIYSQSDIQLVNNETLGKILVDSNGNTLYYFTRDAAIDYSACLGGCASTWPIFYAEDPSVGTGLNPDDFSSFMRSDNVMQTSYQGWPLYYYANDTVVGETNGEARGNVWFVAKPDYSFVLMNDSLVGANGVTYNSKYEPGSEVVQFFTDNKGRSIYGFIADRYDDNNFTKEDFSNDSVWPIYGADSLGAIPSTLDRNLFNVIDVYGRPQFTYNGWPLYYFIQDALRGDTKGVSVPTPGVWPIMVKNIDKAPLAENVLLKTNENLGTLLTDANGNTLYYFTRDAGDDFSACSGGCAVTWPIFHQDTIVPGDGLAQSDFTSFIRADGTMQSSYKGWPLYYYANDTITGETNGEGRGNVWFVAKADYSIMLMNDSLVGADGITYNSSYEAGLEVIQFFTDEEGRSIYTFMNDKNGINNFTKEDFSNDPVWPIYGGDSLGSIPTTLDRDLFGIIDVYGRPQFTYKGWPLYYWGQDSQRGDTKGVSVPTPGVWPITTQSIESAPSDKDIMIKIDENLGEILVDAYGSTLYYFTRDAGNDFSACSGGCLTSWPIFNAEEPAIGDGLDAIDFNTFERADGTMQTSYKGWPLYYYVNDTVIGETNGEARGGVWFVAKPDYSIMLMNDNLVGADGNTYTSNYEQGSEVVQFFTDEEGRTIYIFIIDSLDNNNFTNEDFSNDPVWPIYGSEELGAIPSILDRNLFNIIDVYGKPQFTYNGWPLYYWGQDSLRGDTYGVSVPAPGVWPVAVQGLDVAPSAENVFIKADENLGNILVDGSGNTLYYFSRDAGNDFSACSGGCVNNWPIFHSLNITPGEGLESDDFTSFVRTDGVLQTSYKGWPLYYYKNDIIPGEVNGEAVGNVWFVAKPDYSFMLMNDNLVGANGKTYNSDYEEGSEVVQFFTDENGRTIYIFINDNFDVNNFTNEDFSNNAAWPIYGASELKSIPSTLDGSLFNIIDIFGQPQFTYNGWPLYYFGQDSLRGETKGVSVPTPGIWPVAVQGLEPAISSSLSEIMGGATFKIGPNPFGNQIFIEIMEGNVKMKSLTLYNSMGIKIAEVYKNEFSSSNDKFVLRGLDELAKGLYYLKIMNEKAESTTIKLIH